MRILKSIIILFLILLIGCGIPKEKSYSPIMERDTLVLSEKITEEAIEEIITEDDAIPIEETYTEEIPVEEMSDEEIQDFIKEISDKGQKSILEDIPEQIDDTKKVKSDKSSKIKEKLNRKPSSTEPVVASLVDMYSGTLFYKIDSIFTIDVTTRVEAKITQKIFNDDKESEYIVEMFHDTPNGKVKTEIIRVSNVMDMELISLQHNAFMISKISSSNQIVDNESITEWMWGVTPIKEGEFNLILKAIIKDSDGQKDQIVFDKNINVKNRPKTRFDAQLIFPNRLKRYEKYKVELKLRENKDDSYNFEWSGYGDLEFNFHDKVKIIKIDDNYSISDDRTLYNFEWIIQPEYKDTLNYELKLIGYNDEIIISKDDFFVEKNIKETFLVFFNKIKDKWYWLFTTLIIPLFNFIRNKYIKNNNNKDDDEEVEELEDEIEELEDEIEELKDDINDIKNNG